MPADGRRCPPSALHGPRARDDDDRHAQYCCCRSGLGAASANKDRAAASATLERCRDVKQKMDRLQAKEIKGWANQELDLACYSKNCR